MVKYKLTKDFLGNPAGTLFSLKYWEGKGYYFNINDEIGNVVLYWVREEFHKLNLPDLFEEVKS